LRREWRNAKPILAKPSNIIAHVDGSSTAEKLSCVCHCAPHIKYRTRANTSVVTIKGTRKRQSILDIGCPLIRTGDHGFPEQPPASATPCRSGSTIRAREPANTKKAPSHVAAGPSHGKRTLLRAHNRQHSDAPIHIRVIGVTGHRHTLPVRLSPVGCSFQLGLGILPVMSLRCFLYRCPARGL
jgi:hypothetical protein